MCPQRQYLIPSLLRQNFRGQMLYRRGRCRESFRLRVERCPVVHYRFFSGTCRCGGDGIRSVVAFPTAIPEETLAQRRQFQPPDAVNIPPRQPASADLNPHTVGNRLHVHADRQNLRYPHRLSAWCAGRRQGNLPVKGQEYDGRGQRTESARQPTPA